MKMDEESFIELQKYESSLAKIKESPSKFYVNQDIRKQLKTIYLRITNSKNCTSCNNKWLVRLSAMYFEMKEELNKIKDK